MNLILVINIIACFIVIAVITYTSEKKVKKLQDLHREAKFQNMQLIYSSTQLLIDYGILKEILEEHFTQDEIQDMFQEKKVKLLKGEEDYDR